MSTVPKKYEDWYTEKTEKKSLNEQRKILLATLKALGWEQIDIKSHQDLRNNLKTQLERLNDYWLSEDEWIDCYRALTRADNGTQDIWSLIQKHNTVTLEQKDSSKRLTLIDKNDALKNHFQFLISYPPSTENSSSWEKRCNFTLLINGFPLVHVELQEPKGESLNQALNQTKNLLKENFYTENPIYKFLHIFVISNGTKTRFFAAFQTLAMAPTLSQTSRWADQEHKDIDILEDFAGYFFDRETLCTIITQYSLISTPKDNKSEGKKDLKILRSYQIDAAEKIIEKIKQSINDGLKGARPPGGYIWHATGSGKTLTAFKASELAITVSDKIQKVLFVVDRIDLDTQTYDVFQSVKDNTEIEVRNATNRLELDKHIERNERAIIITTIHKLGNLIKKELRSRRVENDFVLIFDECHRSLKEIFSEIKDVFRNHCIIFGFTGTPIFPPKTKSGENQIINLSSNDRPTQWLFGERIAKYTMLDALEDENVLPFKVKGLEVPDQSSESSEKNNVKRLEWIVRDIVCNFDKWTQRKKGRKFSALFATNSVAEAIEYYKLFKKYIEEIESNLKIAVIFSEDDRRLSTETTRIYGESIQEEQNILIDSWRKIDKHSAPRGSDRLSEKQKRAYKKLLSDNIREVKLDLLIVVDMFLTGFDADRLNSLFLDKDMKQRHTIIQAFARTNRPSKDKKCGRIYWYSGDLENMREAVKEYGGKLWDDEYYKVCRQQLDNLKLSMEKNIEEIKQLEALNVEGSTDDRELKDRLLKKKKDFWKNSKEIGQALSICQEYEEFESEASNGEIEQTVEKYREIANEYHSQFQDDETEKSEENLETGIEGLRSKKILRKRTWRKDKPKHNRGWDEEIDQEYIKRLRGIWEPILGDHTKPFLKLLKSWRTIQPTNKEEWEKSWKNYLDSNDFIAERSREFSNLLLSELENYRILEFMKWAETKIKMNEKIIAEEIGNWFPGESLFSESFTERKEEFFRELEKWYREIREFYNFPAEDLEILLNRYCDTV